MSEHVCLCSVHVKHYMELDLLQWVWSPTASVEKCSPYVSITGCKRYAVLFRKHVSRQSAEKGKAVLEFLGLTPERINLCYQDNPHDEEGAIQNGLIKWQETQGDHCAWQVLLEAMNVQVSQDSTAASSCKSSNN